jgi:hypothetical protein
MSLSDGSAQFADALAQERDGRDVLPVEKEVLYPDTCLGEIVDDMAGEIAQACALAAGAGPAKPKPEGEAPKP